MSGGRGWSVRCVALLALAATACAAGGARNGAQAPRVALLPLGVVLPLPPEVVAGAQPLEAALAAYLAERGFAVDALSFDEARTGWLRSAQELRAQAGESAMNFDAAARRLARDLHAKRGDAALVVPWVAMRSATMKRRMVSWDGVSRQLERYRDRRVNMDDARYLDGLEGSFVSPSLQVAVFSAEGEKVHEGTGGLDLVQDVELQGDPKTGFKVVMPPRDEIFKDPAALREGIALALDGWTLGPKAR